MFTVVQKKITTCHFLWLRLMCICNILQLVELFWDCSWDGSCICKYHLMMFCKNCYHDATFIHVMFSLSMNLTTSSTGFHIGDHFADMFECVLSFTYISPQIRIAHTRHQTDNMTSKRFQCPYLLDL